MNVAVGGAYVGYPTDAQPPLIQEPFSPAEMQVDYLRVCELTPPLQIFTAAKQMARRCFLAGEYCVPFAGTDQFSKVRNLVRSAGDQQSLRAAGIPAAMRKCFTGWNRPEPEQSVRLVARPHPSPRGEGISYCIVPVENLLKHPSDAAYQDTRPSRFHGNSPTCRPGPSPGEFFSRPLIKNVAPSVPFDGYGGLEAFAREFAEIELEEKADAVGTAAMRTDGIYAVAVLTTAIFPAYEGESIKHAAADPAQPVAGLNFAGQIIHHRATDVGSEVPSFFMVDGQQVIGIEQRELACAS